MKIIYVFLTAFILSIVAFFLAFSLIDNSFAGLFLLEMLPVTFIVILLYTNLLNSFQVKAFKYVVLYTLIACYVMVFISAFLLGSDSRWGLRAAFFDALYAIMNVYLLICNIAIALIYSTLFVLFSRLSRKKNK